MARMNSRIQYSANYRLVYTVRDRIYIRDQGKGLV